MEHEDELGDYYRCETRLLDNYGECLEDASCDISAIADCTYTYEWHKCSSPGLSIGIELLGCLEEEGP